VSGQMRTSVLTTVGVAASVVGLTVTQPVLSTVAPVALAALIVEGSFDQPVPATASKTSFRASSSSRSPTVYVNFLTGPFGIGQAVTQHPVKRRQPREHCDVPRVGAPPMPAC